MEKKCIIAGAGDFFEKKLPKEKGDFLIAADGGLDSLLKIDVMPDLFVGDRDSSKADLNIIEGLYFPTKKNDSDTLLAVKEGIKRGYKTFYIFGGTGGRIDHTIANIKVLEFLSENCMKGFLFSHNQVITVIQNSEISFPKEFEGYFSVFPTGGNANGVCIKGSGYTLDNYNFESSSSLGLSNYFKGEITSIKVTDGSVIVIFERQGEFIFGL